MPVGYRTDANGLLQYNPEAVVLRQTENQATLIRLGEFASELAHYVELAQRLQKQKNEVVISPAAHHAESEGKSSSNSQAGDSTKRDDGGNTAPPAVALAPEVAAKSSLILSPRRVSNIDKNASEIQEVAAKRTAAPGEGVSVSAQEVMDAAIRVGLHHSSEPIIETNSQPQEGTEGGADAKTAPSQRSEPMDPVGNRKSAKLNSSGPIIETNNSPQLSKRRAGANTCLEAPDRNYGYSTAPDKRSKPLDPDGDRYDALEDRYYDDDAPVDDDDLTETESETSDTENVDHCHGRDDNKISRKKSAAIELTDAESKASTAIRQAAKAHTVPNTAPPPIMGQFEDAEDMRKKSAAIMLADAESKASTAIRQDGKAHTVTPITAPPAITGQFEDAEDKSNLEAENILHPFVKNSSTLEKFTYAMSLKMSNLTEPEKQHHARGINNMEVRNKPAAMQWNARMAIAPSIGITPDVPTSQEADHRDQGKDKTKKKAAGIAIEESRAMKKRWKHGYNKKYAINKALTGPDHKYRGMNNNEISRKKSAAMNRTKGESKARTDPNAPPPPVAAQFEDPEPPAVKSSPTLQKRAGSAPTELEKDHHDQGTNNSEMMKNPTAIKPSEPSVGVTLDLNNVILLDAKGRCAGSHPGNKKLNDMISAHLGTYKKALECCTKTHSEIFNQILHLVEQARVTGFVMQGPSGCWQVVDRSRARNAISLAFREALNSDRCTVRARDKPTISERANHNDDKNAWLKANKSEKMDNQHGKLPNKDTARATISVELSKPDTFSASAGSPQLSQNAGFSRLPASTSFQNPQQLIRRPSPSAMSPNLGGRAGNVRLGNNLQPLTTFPNPNNHHSNPNKQPNHHSNDKLWLRQQQFLLSSLEASSSQATLHLVEKQRQLEQQLKQICQKGDNNHHSRHQHNHPSWPNFHNNCHNPPHHPHHHQNDSMQPHSLGVPPFDRKVPSPQQKLQVYSYPNAESPSGTWQLRLHQDQLKIFSGDQLLTSTTIIAMTAMTPADIMASTTIGAKRGHPASPQQRHKKPKFGDSEKTSSASIDSRSSDLQSPSSSSKGGGAATNNEENPVEIDGCEAQKEKATAEILEPGPHDVLLGRRNQHHNIDQHSGNVNFRKLADAVRIRYLSCTKIEKPDVGREMLELWKNLDPPGRVLYRKEEGKKYESTDGWIEAPERKARERATYALRIRTPDAERYINQLNKLRDGQMKQAISNMSRLCSERNVANDKVPKTNTGPQIALQLQRGQISPWPRTTPQLPQLYHGVAPRPHQQMPPQLQQQQLVKQPSPQHTQVHLPAQQHQNNQIVLIPSTEDILCGHDKRYLTHPGNLYFDRFIVPYAIAYGQASTSKVEMAVADNVVDVMQSRRFLKLKEGTNQWEVLPPDKIRKRIYHALKVKSDEMERTNTERK